MTAQAYRADGAPGRTNGHAHDFTADDLGVPRVTRFADLLDDLAADAQAAYDAARTGIPRGPVSGLGRLDRRLGGALAPGLHILHAAPGIGKTALALQIAAQGPYPALFVTCEMAPVELVRRTIARCEGTYLGKLKDGSLHPDAVVEKAKRAAEQVPLLSIADATRWAASRPWIETEATATFAGHPSGLIVIDSLHSWADAFDDIGDEYARLASALKALQAIAATLSCPILVVCERNRASMKTGGLKDGGLSAGAGHRGIEFRAETVLGLDFDDDKSSKSLPMGERAVTLSIAKNRHGECGKVDLIFTGGRQLWREA